MVTQQHGLQKGWRPIEQAGPCAVCPAQGVRIKHERTTTKADQTRQP